MVYAGTTFLCELQSFLIFDSFTQKYLYYMMDMWEVPSPLTPWAIVGKFNPEPLSKAQYDLPCFKLTEANYGF